MNIEKIKERLNTSYCDFENKETDYIEFIKTDVFQKINGCQDQSSLYIYIYNQTDDYNRIFNGLWVCENFRPFNINSKRINGNPRDLFKELCFRKHNKALFQTFKDIIETKYISIIDLDGFYTKYKEGLDLFDSDIGIGNDLFLNIDITNPEKEYECPKDVLRYLYDRFNSILTDKISEIKGEVK